MEVVDKDNDGEADKGNINDAEKDKDKDEKRRTPEDVVAHARMCFRLFLINIVLVDDEAMVLIEPN